jgi:HlyD family secretion protein
MKKRTWWVGAVALAVLAGGAAWWWSSRSAGGEVAYRTGKLERGGLLATVSASGNVNPVSQVSVSSQISGQIKELFADFNSEVKAGQLIAQIDPATYEYRVRSAEADLDAAQATVLTAQANATVARAAVSRAQTDLAEARRIHDRNLRLIDQGFIAQSEADRTRAAVATAEEALKGAQAQVGVTEAQIKTAQATVAQRGALVAQAKVDLGRTRIVSPVGGIVIKRAVEQGQTVAASLQAPEMFVIAQNLSDMQVDASIDEADVGRIRSGQKASFTVDAFPGQTFEGEVRQVRKAAQNVANVVTYIAVVGFQNTSGRLLPGMTANVRVVTDQRESVLKVPNAALRVRVPGVEPEKRAEKPDQASAGGQKDAKNDAPAVAAAAAPPGPGGNSPATEFRHKLVAELKLDAAQVEKVDALYTEARPRFMALRDLSADERPKARERITADIRARIGDLLTPEQKPKYAALVAENAGRQSTRGRIHLLGVDNKPMAFDVRLGISDGSATELLVRPGSPEADALTEGATVITGLPTSASAAPKPAAGGPRPPF